MNRRLQGQNEHSSRHAIAVYIYTQRVDVGAKPLYSSKKGTSKKAHEHAVLRRRDSLQGRATVCQWIICCVCSRHGPCKPAGAHIKRSKAQLRAHVKDIVPARAQALAWTMPARAARPLSVAPSPARRLSAPHQGQPAWLLSYPAPRPPSSRRWCAAGCAACPAAAAGRG